MIVDKDFLTLVAKQNKHTFISQVCPQKTIDFAVETFRKENCSFELMHCVLLINAR